MAKIIVAGASGFIGKHLVRTLRAEGHYVIGLTRSAPLEVDPKGVNEWRACDLFSAKSAIECLKDCDLAYYLVHSMAKTARLTQATFEDCDLLASLNFALAAEKNKIQQIIYLGGLIPTYVPEEKLSRHLRSRLEVERALASTSVPVTTLRSGLIIGPEGSSFQIMYNLTRRLGVMVLPRWTQNATTPIWLDDVIGLLMFCLDRKECIGQTFDIGGPTTLAYKKLLAVTAKALGKWIWFYDIPFFTTKLSRLWVALISRQPRALVAPLVESLKYPMVPRDRRLQEMAQIPGRPVEDAIREAVATIQNKKVDRKLKHLSATAKTRAIESTVHSIQRITTAADFSHSQLSNHMGEVYFKWLANFLFFLEIFPSETFVSIRIRYLKWTMLTFERVIENDLEIFYIRGGFLARHGIQGFLEFRPVPNTHLILSVVESFRPRLPWYFYKYTQALIHAWVMRTFGIYVSKLKGNDDVRTAAAKCP